MNLFQVLVSHCMKDNQFTVMMVTMNRICHPRGRIQNATERLTFLARFQQGVTSGALIPRGVNFAVRSEHAVGK